MIAKKYEITLNKIKPYLFCNAQSLSSFDLAPFGIEVTSDLIFDCTKTSSEKFFNKITKMDEISFGDQEMGMDRWVLYDCSAMPGAIFGFAIEQAGEWTPISMYIAIPMVEKDHWFGHNLSSLNIHLGGLYPGLGLLTKVFALKVLNITKQYGATQWGSAAINIHAKLSPLKLITSYTPIHTHKNSLTYLAQYSSESLKKILAGEELVPLETSFELDGSDNQMLQQLQKKIENGDILIISGKPQTKDGKIYYNIHQQEG